MAVEQSLAADAFLARFLVSLFLIPGDSSSLYRMSGSCTRNWEGKGGRKMEERKRKGGGKEEGTINPMFVDPRQPIGDFWCLLLPTDGSTCTQSSYVGIGDPASFPRPLNLLE